MTSMAFIFGMLPLVIAAVRVRPAASQSGPACWAACWRPHSSRSFLCRCFLCYGEKTDRRTMASGDGAMHSPTPPSQSVKSDAVLTMRYAIGRFVITASQLPYSCAWARTTQRPPTDTEDRFRMAEGRRICRPWPICPGGISLQMSSCSSSFERPLSTIGISSGPSRASMNFEQGRSSPRSDYLPQITAAANAPAGRKAQFPVSRFCQPVQLLLVRQLVVGSRSVGAHQTIHRGGARGSVVQGREPPCGDDSVGQRRGRSLLQSSPV